MYRRVAFLKTDDPEKHRFHHQSEENQQASQKIAFFWGSVTVLTRGSGDTLLGHLGRVNLITGVERRETGTYSVGSFRKSQL
jgi:hypothetical protein